VVIEFVLALVDDSPELRGITGDKRRYLAARDIAREYVMKLSDDRTRLRVLPDDEIDPFTLQGNELDAGDVHRLALVSDCNVS